MSLDEELERTRGFADGSADPPPNEEATCQWVIVPLLYNIGYAPNEVAPQTRDQGGKLPDYTMLNGTDYTWFLEAKKWSRHLDNDSDLVQALNYANTAGRRWVVLTNGREWRLFDNHRYDCPAADRLVACAHVENDAEIRPFLAAISRQSMTNGGPGGYAALQTLGRVLDVQLGKAGTAVVRAIRSALRKCHVDAKDDDIVRYFQGRAANSVAGSDPPVNSQLLDGELGHPRFTQDGFDPGVTGVTGTDIGLTSGGEYTLEELYKGIVDKGCGVVTGAKPTMVLLPGKPVHRVSSWKEATVTIVTYVYEGDAAPSLPYSAAMRGPNVFLNTVPRHRDNRKAMIYYAEIRIGSRTVYMDSNRSAENFMRTLWSLCKVAGIDPKTVSIGIR